MKLERQPTTLYVTDGENRGPLTMARLRFHPRRPRLLLGQCSDRRLALWNLDDEPRKVDRRKEASIVAALVCPHDLGWIRGFDVAPDGGSLVTGGSDRRLRRWSWNADAGPSEKPTHDVEAAHAGWIEAVAFSPDGRLVATVGADHRAKIWRADTLNAVVTLEGHENFVRDVAWSPRGDRLYTAGEDGFVHVWNTAGKALGSIEFGDANDQQGQNPKLSGAHAVAVSSDGRWVAAAGGAKVGLFDASTFEIVASESAKHEVAFHPRRPVLLAGESKLEAWEFEAAKLKPPKRDSKGRPGKVSGVPGKKFGSINRGEYSLGIAFAPDEDLVAVGKGDGSVELWRIV